MNPEEINEMNSYQQVERLNNFYLEIGDDIDVEFFLQTHTVECDPDAVPDLANRDPETGEFYQDEDWS